MNHENLNVLIERAHLKQAFATNFRSTSKIVQKENRPFYKMYLGVIIENKKQYYESYVEDWENIVLLGLHLGRLDAVWLALEHQINEGLERKIFEKLTEEKEKKNLQKLFFIKRDPFLEKDRLEEDYKKAKEKTTEAGDLLYMIGLCRLEIRKHRECPKKKRYNLKKAIELFERASEEYPAKEKEKVAASQTALKRAESML